MEKFNTIGTWAPRNQEQYQTLAAECSRAGVKVEFAPFRFGPEGLVGPRGTKRLNYTPRQLQPMLGFMVWTQGLDSGSLPRFVSHLAAYERPVAVLDVGAAVDFRPLLRPGSRTRVFDLGPSPRCAQLAARYLLDSGHRRIAYITHSPAPDTRESALKQAFALAGLPGAVSAFRFTPVTWKETGSVRSQSGTLDSFIERLNSGKTLRHRLLQRALARYRDRLSGHLREEAIYLNLAPVLEAALRHEDITAWVAEDDSTAVRCLEFLQARDVALPQRLSLLGFDDTEEALLRGISSYNFNIPGIMHAMVEHIVRPHPVRGSRERVVIDGFINVRQTSGRAPRI